MMTKRAWLGAALIVTAVSATIADGAIGSANAKPRESANCGAIYQAMSDSADMAQAAYAQGDEAGGDYWMQTYDKASANHARFCT